MKLSGARIIVELLRRQGIDIVAGIPGGCNLPLYHALAESGIRHVLTRHEQGAGFLAQGMARVSGKPAVCLATSGPGATNLLTAIADAKLDSIPLVAITGQVPTETIGTDAFQEVDTYGLTLPITKHNFLVREAAELLRVIPEAFRIAASGRCGPVAVDVTKNAQTEPAEFAQWPEPGCADPVEPPGARELAVVAGKINGARRPVLYIGGGVRAAGAAGLARALAEKNSLPVTTSLMGLDCLPHDHPLNLRLLGMHGSRTANLVIEEADLLIAVGVRFDDRATGKAGEFCRRADVVHIDIDRSELDKIKPSNISVAADAAAALSGLLALVEPDPRRDWRARVAAIRSEHPNEPPLSGDLSHPVNIIRAVSRLASPDAIIVTDVGQHQMWTAQAYPFNRPGTFLTSGGMGTMGFGLPAAIGASLAAPGREIILFTGDGSILMNIQELATVSEVRPNLKVFVLNNRQLGLVRQQQELFYEGRCFASRFESVPDFAALARAFGVPGLGVEKSGDRAAILAEAMRTPGPCLVDLPVTDRANVYPMVPPGAANREMIGDAPCLIP